MSECDKCNGQGTICPECAGKFVAGTSGRSVYATYAQVQDDINNCEVDAWEDLNPEERKAWDELARRLNLE